MQITVAVERKEDLELFRLFAVLQMILADDDGDYEMTVGKMFIRLEARS